MIPTICISIGDCNGVGPEIILKSLTGPELSQKATLVILGHQSVLRHYQKSTAIDVKAKSISDVDEVAGIPGIYCLDVVSDSPNITTGKLSKESGKLSMMAIEQGAKACINQKAHALVTAPISKEAIQLAGYNFPGHTEYLANLCQTDDFVMMLVNSLPLRVALVTIHEPLSKVAEMVTSASILKTIRIIHQYLVDNYGISNPKLAILGLNPHAGDGGVIGKEEIDIIQPAIRKANEQRQICDGPFPADGFFANQTWKKFDAVLAMYHDQGLIPFKTLSFNAGVNITAGLPIIRTSPDHGTAFDIAGLNQANPGSFTEALELGFKLAQNKFNR